jgi:hypothetical protein
MRHLLVVSLLCVCACSGDDSSAPWAPAQERDGGGFGGSSQGGSSQGGSSQAGASQGGSSQGGSSQAGAGGSSGAPHIPMCAIGCSTAADCAIPNSYPASEYACESGGCVYKGCTSDAICKQVFQNDAYVCRPSSYGMNMCVKGCATVADCDLGTPMYSTDNYVCKTDYCDYTGCTGDAECQESMQKSSYRCVLMPSLGIKMCQPGCSSQSDCGVASSPAYSSSHYACEQNLCVYKGCVSDAECKDSMMNDKYVCK